MTPDELKAKGVDLGDPTTMSAIKILKAVLDTVDSAGDDGAPAGPMYLAFQRHGLGLEEFEMVTSTLTNARLITKRGDVYYSNKQS